MLLKCAEPGCGYTWNATRGFQYQLALHDSTRVRCTLCRAYQKRASIIRLLAHADARIERLEAARFRRGL
jgi:hypothetical protein